MTVKYSIVIPVYNERENLAPLRNNIINVMQHVDSSFEMIFVDDGSDDGSREIIKKLALVDPHAHYVLFDQNHGQTAAFDAGFKAATGEIIITMDADLQVDANDIPLLLDKLDKYDAAVGFRQKRNDKWIKRISSIIANSVRNRLSDESIQDVGCPLKAFKSEAIKKLKLFEGMHRFLPTLLKLEGFTVVEVPINHYHRLYGKSKYNIRNRLFKSLRDLFAVRWMKKRCLRYKIIEKG